MEEQFGGSLKEKFSSKTGSPENAEAMKGLVDLITKRANFMEKNIDMRIMSDSEVSEKAIQGDLSAIELESLNEAIGAKAEKIGLNEDDLFKLREKVNKALDEKRK